MVEPTFFKQLSLEYDIGMKHLHQVKTLWNVIYIALHAWTVRDVFESNRDVQLVGTLCYCTVSIVITAAQLIARYLRLWRSFPNIVYWQVFFCCVNLLLHLIQMCIVYALPYFNAPADTQYFFTCLAILGWSYYSLTAFYVLTRYFIWSLQRKSQQQPPPQTIDDDSTRCVPYQVAREEKKFGNVVYQSLSTGAEPIDVTSVKIQPTTGSANGSASSGDRERIGVGSNGSASSGDASQCSDCSICLDTFENNCEVCQLACGHYFHVVCIYTWLQTETNRLRHDRKCPICQQCFASCDVASRETNV